MDASTVVKNQIFDHIEIGLGTWAWGDRLMWNYGKGYQDEDLRQIFQAAVESKIVFFDTAEVYGQGRSETLIGQFLQQGDEKPILATKFMPYPWRLSKKALEKALRGSLKRLGLQQVDLYQIHWPLPPVTIETWMGAMVDVFQRGLIRSVGVSNYSIEQMMRAHNALVKEGVSLAANQVEFNLLNRQIEKNGLLQRCLDLGVTCIAYSPLAMGLLTGKYTPDNAPGGVRGSRISKKMLQNIQPLIRLMNQIGGEHGGKTAAQVALNWTICKGAVPIPGAKTIRQFDQNMGAIGWRLSDQEISELDEMSDRCSA